MAIIGCMIGICGSVMGIWGYIWMGDWFMVVYV